MLLIPVINNVMYGGNATCLLVFLLKVGSDVVLTRMIVLLL